MAAPGFFFWEKGDSGFLVFKGQRPKTEYWSIYPEMIRTGNRERHRNVNRCRFG
ncbi:MAG: hypothetical protein [Olavius algarvensis Delta 4 endosymbiont]|nr:MAG: hypothetical protein [Olavius algarvensis Delta 4 endosymbiont]